MIPTRPAPRWRRWTPRQRALVTLAEAIDMEAALWPAGTQVRRALGRALRAVQTAARESNTET